jgi:hypothetical protein
LHDFSCFKKFTRRNDGALTKALSFTKAQITRIIAAMREAGIEPNYVSIQPDGTINVAHRVFADVPWSPPTPSDEEWNFRA